MISPLYFYSDVPWPDGAPMCGAVYPLEKVAGDPVLCDSEPHPVTGPAAVKHRHAETGFEWWDTTDAR